MPLTQSEMDEADHLFVSLTFGSEDDKARAEKSLRTWAGADPERLGYLEEHAAVDRIVDAQLGTLQTRYARRVVPKSARRASVARRSWPRTAMIFGTSAIAVAAALVTVYVNPVLSTQEFNSAVGEQRQVALGDGSTVLLNTSTSLVYENRLRSREVRLKQGEVLFSVAHNAFRPFHVAANEVSIRDIGTVFSVRADPAMVSVAVLEGEVEMSSGDRKIALHMNEAATADASQTIYSEDAEFQKFINWKDRRLEFSSAPLADVVQELQRYRGAPITFADAKAKNYRVTGGFSSANPDLLLKTLPDVAPVTVQLRPDGEAIIASRR